MKKTVSKVSWGQEPIPRRSNDPRDVERSKFILHCEAITKCGALLAQVSPAGSGDNPDELPNTLIQEP